MVKYVLEIAPLGQPSKAVYVTPGETVLGNLVSPWLVSAGQNFPVEVRVKVIEDSEPGNSLIDARFVLGPKLTDPTFSLDVCYIPSERPLHAILADAVKHGVDYPTHGVDCSCMSRFVYEVKHHVLRSLPIRTFDIYLNTDEWNTSFQARMRVRNILRQAVRDL